MRGLLLRVGIDKGTGGCLGPIFPDGRFEYIPKPETRATSEIEVYKNMKGRYGMPFTKFVPEKYWYSHPHHDPEFITYTYGDPTPTKRKQLSELSSGDLLIFYAGLQPIEKKDGARLFVIGYFDIENVYDFRRIDPPQYSKVFEQLQNNAHSKIYNRLKELNIEYLSKISEINNLVVVKGGPKNSKLLPKVLPLGDDNDHPLEDMRLILGYDKSLTRAVGHKIDENHVQKVKKWLEHNNPRAR